MPYPVVEPFAVPDIYVDKLVLTEEAGPDLLRFIFAAKQTCLFTGQFEYVVRAKLLVRRDSAMSNQRMAAKGMGMTCGRVFGG